MSAGMRSKQLNAARALSAIMEHGYDVEIRRTSMTMYAVGLKEPDRQARWYDAGTPLDALLQVDLATLAYVHEPHLEFAESDVQALDTILQDPEETRF